MRFARKWGIKKKFHGDGAIERLCKDPGVDAVIVALPNDLHLPAITTAAENGKDIICEKPLGRNLAEADEALRIVRRRKVVHCYAENQIIHPPDCEGKVVHSGRGAREGHVDQVQGGRTRVPTAGGSGTLARVGGVLLDMGCHSIEVTRHLFGANPEATSGWTATLGHKTTLEDNSLVLLRYQGGGARPVREQLDRQRGPGRAPRGLRDRGVAVHRHDERDRDQGLHHRFGGEDRATSSRRPTPSRVGSTLPGTSSSTTDTSQSSGTSSAPSPRASSPRRTSRTGGW